MVLIAPVHFICKILPQDFKFYKGFDSLYLFISFYFNGYHMYFIFHTALSNLSFTGFKHAGYHIMIFNYEWFLTSAHVCKNLQFYFQLELVSIRPFVDSNRDGRHVPFFTSNCMFEARGCTIITIQDSQDEKFQNLLLNSEIPLWTPWTVIINLVPSVAVTGQKYLWNVN